MHLLKKIENLPVGATATSVGLATLANVWTTGGYVAVRHFIMVIVILVWLAALIKLVFFNSTLRKDYANPVPGSLYATYAMLTMIIGSYLADFNLLLGQVIWLIGVILHMIHILVFTKVHVFKGIKIETFLPTWFVTYCGIMVSTVVGNNLGFYDLRFGILVYGFIIYVVLFTAMVIRTLAHRPYPKHLEMTFAIFFAPTSLLFVSYLNVIANPIPWVVYAVYGIILITVIFVFIRIPAFLRVGFSPGHAALTFPLAIALVATFRMSDYLTQMGYTTLGHWLYHLFSIQMFITTAIVLYVGYGFFLMLRSSLSKK